MPSFVPVLALMSCLGIPAVLKEVASYITERDGVGAANPADLFLTAGASEGISLMLSSIISNPSVGV